MEMVISIRLDGDIGEFDMSEITDLAADEIAARIEGEEVLVSAGGFDIILSADVTREE